MIILSGKVEEVREFLKDKAGQYVRVTMEFGKPTSQERTCATLPATTKDTGQLFLNADEVAVLLGFTDRKNPRRAVRHLHYSKQLKAVKVSGRLRWKLEDVEAFARKLKQ